MTHFQASSSVVCAQGKGATASHAQALLAGRQSNASDTGRQRLQAAISEISSHLLHLADKDSNGSISIDELASLFDGGLNSEDEGGGEEGGSSTFSSSPSKLDLYELRGCLQLLPRISRHYEGTALATSAWHDKVLSLLFAITLPSRSPTLALIFTLTYPNPPLHHRLALRSPETSKTLPSPFGTLAVSAVSN